MRKITDFIVNKRYYILALFIILAIISSILSNKVIINKDITKYLPNSSETRIGMDIMEEEFNDDESSSLLLMFANLEDDEKTKIKDDLQNIEYVDSVDYELENEDYNKDEYTLYSINVDYPANSSQASAVYNTICDKYGDYEFYTNGNIVENNAEVLPEWIVILAVSCALVILIIMCPSFVEAFLFLFVILLAVLLNKGTNLIFSSVSNITESISAILQMALSMDYSIMLMNRYIQEKQKENDKVKAMKNALHHSFQSISSSSVTTIVGLLALIFMSFTIGKDLGLVLAKGVLLSLLCIFTCLPALILLFDKWIEKTKKKTPNINLKRMGNASYKCRFVGLPLLLLIFGVSFMLKGNLNIEYVHSDPNKIDEIFPANKQIAIVYKNENEEIVSNYCKEIENISGVDELLGYGNTINEKLKYDEFNQKTEDLGNSMNVDDYMLKILYYNYYNKDNNLAMTFNEFVNFIKNKVYNNNNMSEKIDNSMRQDVDKLEKFTTVNSVNQKRSKQELASLFEIDQSSLNNLLVYYNSKNINLSLSINQFIDFMNKNVLTNKLYSQNISSEEKNNLNTLSKFTDKNKINQAMKYDEIANLFGVDNELVKQLFTYYQSLQEIDITLSVNEFANFILTDVANDSNYASMFDSSTLEKITLLENLSNPKVINEEMKADGISKMFGIDEGTVRALFLFKFFNTNDSNTMSPYNFISFVLENQTNPYIAPSLNDELLQQINYAKMIMDSGNENLKYTYTQMAQVMNMDESTIKNLYTLYVSQNSQVLMAPVNFVKFILDHKNDELLTGKLNAETLEKLVLINQIMDGVNENKKYNPLEMSDLLGIEKENLKLLYSLYSSIYINSNTQLSIKEFVGFILNDVVNNKDYSGSFDNASKQKLSTVNEIINSTINNKKYSKNEMYSILSKLANDLDSNLIDLVYLYYGSEYEYNNDWSLTIEELTNYLNNDILTDSKFDDFIKEDMRQQITDSKETVQDAKEMLVGNEYSRVVIYSNLEEEGEEAYNLISSIKENLSSKNDGIYVVGNSAMSYEMDQTFEGELNKITLITMIAIFIVVAITFKSITIPTILVFIIQSAIYTTMGVLSFMGGSVYFIALLIVQSILMGATIDYAIVFTSYYLELRKKLDRKESVIESYNKSIHTILTSSSILIIVTFILGILTNGITSKICKTISLGTLCSTILILLILPPILVLCDKVIVKKHHKKKDEINE